MIVDISLRHQMVIGLCEQEQNGKGLQLTAMFVCLSVVHPIGLGRHGLSQVEGEDVSLENVCYALSYLF